ncbi:hypothetical protein VR46_37115, partial [Streptomyces sp. NRRL S-444]
MSVSTLVSGQRASKPRRGSTVIGRVGDGHLMDPLAKGNPHVDGSPRRAPRPRRPLLGAVRTRCRGRRLARAQRDRGRRARPVRGHRYDGRAR